MEDKLPAFFTENNFDTQEPHEGHLERFQKRLENKARPKTSWKWMSIAASIILVLGFWLGENHQKNQIDLADISPKMEEVQNYFVSTINRELKELEKTRSLETETTIEHALDELQELEESYALFVKDLTRNGLQKKIIAAMIANYQQRLEILENVLKHIEIIKKSKHFNNESYL
jgi:cytoskeletal protein RodZ